MYVSVPNGTKRNDEADYFEKREAKLYFYDTKPFVICR